MTDKKRKNPFEDCNEFCKIFKVDDAEEITLRPQGGIDFGKTVSFPYPSSSGELQITPVITVHLPPVNTFEESDLKGYVTTHYEFR